jgi:hypothetical protein
VACSEHQLYDAPLVVTEFIAHNSQLRRWSLNHGEAVSNICLNVRFQGLSRHRVVPRGESANDPKRTSGVLGFRASPFGGSTLHFPTIIEGVRLSSDVCNWGRLGVGLPAPPKMLSDACLRASLPGLGFLVDCGKPSECAMLPRAKFLRGGENEQQAAFRRLARASYPLHREIPPRGMAKSPKDCFF